MKLFPEFKYPYKRCHRYSCNKNLCISYKAQFNKVQRCCFESILLEYGPTLAMKYNDIHNPSEHLNFIFKEIYTDKILESFIVDNSKKKR